LRDIETTVRTLKAITKGAATADPAA
jgi:hypothetical protein